MLFEGATYHSCLSISSALQIAPNRMLKQYLLSSSLAVTASRRELSSSGKFTQLWRSLNQTYYHYKHSICTSIFHATTAQTTHHSSTPLGKIGRLATEEGIIVSYYGEVEKSGSRQIRLQFRQQKSRMEYKKLTRYTYTWL